MLCDVGGVFASGVCSRFSKFLFVAFAAKQYNLRKNANMLFEEYIDDNEVVFKSDEHRLAKLQVFKSNLAKIKTLNNKYPGTHFNLNKFALLSTEEFKEMYLHPIKTIRPSHIPVAPEVSQEYIEALPDTFDWRNNNPKVVTDVKDQGQCGSCWSFSTTGNIEGQWALAGNTLISLSEQNLVDCDHKCSEFENEQACDAGCDGGLPQNAYEYVISAGGINTEKAYPYEGVDGTCRFKPANNGAKISNWTFVSTNEAQIQAYLVANGPLSIAVDAVEWQFYFGGVFYLPCGSDLDHAVLLVGYGVETDIFFQNMPYWTVKNSWGDWWGSSGYIFVERGVGECGINTYVTSAIIKK